jgi:hypothetical protein
VRSDHVSSLVEVVGAVAVVVGVGMLSFAAGWIVGGGLAILFAYRAGL